MIVLLDSGIWISALEFEGTPAHALIHAQTADTMLFCTQIEDEVIRIMGKKFARNPENVRRRMKAFLKDSTWIVVTGSLSGVCRDPKDDFVLECAAKGKAELIVTGDKDLLSLKSYGATEILTPRQYLDRAKLSPPRK